MKIRKLLSAFLLLFVIPVFTFAQDNNLQPVECFDPGLYKFQSISVTAGLEQDTIHVSNNSGDKINFVGKVSNSNDYPIVDGYLFARLSRVNDNNWETEGHHIIEEKILYEKVSIPAKSSLPIYFNWQMPKNSDAGNYRIDYFFSVDKRFNLGGLPFTNEIIAGFSTFEIMSNTKTPFVIDRTMTSINGQTYVHIGNWPEFEKNSNVSISQPVKNLLDKEIELNIKYDLYYWDSLREEDLIKTNTEKVKILPNSTFNLTYNVENIDRSVYYLKISISGEEYQSLVNIRFLTTGYDFISQDGEWGDTLMVSNGVGKARINYQAITSFPIKKGEEFRAFICYHNTSIGSDELKNISLKLFDKKGNLISSGNYKTSISSEVEAATINVAALEKLNYVKLVSEITDSEGNILDTYTAEYDCKVIDPLSCGIFSMFYLVYLFLAIITLALLVLVYSKIKSGKLRSITIALLSVLLIVFLFLGIYTIFNGPKIGFAQPVISGTNRALSHSFNFSVGYTSAGDTRTAFKNGTATRNITGRLLGNNGTTLQIGQKVYVELASSCTYNASGGAWDTPNCGTNLSVRDGNRTAVMRINGPSLRADLALNNSNLSCTKISNVKWECTAQSAGTTKITANVNSGSATLFGCIYTNVRTAVTSNNTGNNNPGCGVASGKPVNAFMGFEGVPGRINRNFNGGIMTWDITVLANTSPTNGQCHPTATTDGTTAPVAPLCSSGQASSINTNANSWTWTCNGLNGGTSTNCTRNKTTPTDGGGGSGTGDGGGSGKDGGPST